MDAEIGAGDPEMGLLDTGRLEGRLDGDTGRCEAGGALDMGR